MSIGQRNKWVTLSRSPQTSNDADGFYEDLDPPGVWMAIQPVLGSVGERTTDSVCETAFHKQITVDTRILYVDTVLSRTREFFVKSVQNVEERNRVMRLIVEEVQP